MHYPHLLFLSLVIAVVSCRPSLQTGPDATDYTQWVNPLIGTDFTGNTYPGAQAPFGMVQLSPDNGLPGWDRISGYFYPDSTINGFSHTHLSGTGAGDLYDIAFMPYHAPAREGEGTLGIYSQFDHATEEAHAGYYAVTLKDYDIRVELTATPRCGIQRYTYTHSQPRVALKLSRAMNWDQTCDTYVELVDSVTLRGYRMSRGWARDQRVYFYTRLSQPVAQMHIDSVPLMEEGRKIGMGYDADLAFAPTDSGSYELQVCTALSGVSMEGARLNLEKEALPVDFDRLLAESKKSWNAQLGRIEVPADADADEKTTFYTALYHTMLAPTLYGDVDGQYWGADKAVHQADGWDNYSTFSLWDTYRAAHPLYTLVCPERVNSMVHSFLAFQQQSGRLPVWNMWGTETDMMIGYHAVPVIVDAYLKGIGNFDVEQAWTACLASAHADGYRGIGFYKQKGYVPYDVKDEYNADNWSLSRTLEYAFDDYAIARLAEKMGKNAETEEFDARAKHYENLYDAETGFFRPKNARGEFQPDFNPDAYTSHICESNAWHYLWSVQQDIPALVHLLGGEQRFTQKLDSMFTYVPEDKKGLPLFSTGMIGQYAHGNEPSHHVAYLYNAVRQPWKTAQYVDQIRRDFYRNTPDGLCGNEDCGQMSAWYVFSAMGFYPVNPVGGVYELGTPMFESLYLRLPEGKTFSVLAPGVSVQAKYVQSVQLNGQPYTKSYITHEQIMQGGTLQFEMGSEPGKVWYE